MIRKIQSAQETQKKRERNNRIMVIILGLILLFSTAGYFASDYASTQNPSIKYKGIEFKQNDYGYWSFIISKQEYITQFNPQDTENVSINAQKALGEYSGKVLYIASPGSKDYSENARTEISRNLYPWVTKENFVCLDQDCLEDYPIKNCSEDNIISFQKSETSQVIANEKCIILEYKDGEAELVADAFIFRILGLQ